MKYFAKAVLCLFVIPVAAAYGEGDRIGLNYHDPDTTKFLESVLQSMKLPYTTQSSDGDTTIFWNSSGETQEEEIRNRVSQYVFIRDVCKALPIPLPSDPAKTELSCKQ